MAAPRVLILTASFGDGHNSAARGLAGALAQVSGGALRIETLDLIRLAQPLTSGALEGLYKFAITHVPWGWHQFYRIAGHLPVNQDPLGALSRVKSALAREIGREPPAAVLVTFPLYPHLIQQLFDRPPFPVFTVVTDSISIHPIWLNAVTTTFFAADEISAAHLRRIVPQGSEVVDSGFPVSPVFSEMPVPPPGVPLRRVLYFPATSRRVVRLAMTSLLRDGPAGLEVTVVLGRHAARLRPVVDQCRAGFPSRRVDVLGWTTEVPRLLTEHDLVIAKAGGATTHECGAAGRPLIVTKVVPGQEEGNAELVQRRRSGLHEEDPEALGLLLERMNTSGQWQALREAAWRHRRADGALTIARHVLSRSGDSASMARAGTISPLP